MGITGDGDELSKDEALENAIVTSITNPRHCLYFMEKGRTVAKTIINSAEMYELELREEYENSVHSHEFIHFISANQTNFKRMLVLEALTRSFVRGSDFHFIYDHEVVPMLEAFAIFYQCAIPETPEDLREHIITQISVSQPSILRLMWDIKEFLEKLMEKCVLKIKYFPKSLFVILINAIFSTPNIVKERIFDRFRVLKDIEKIPEWKEPTEIGAYIGKVLRQNGFSISSASYGAPESLVSCAFYLSELKNLLKNLDIDEELFERYIFGILSEIDLSFGGILYVCDSLKTLEGKRIKGCYMGRIPKELLLSSTKHTIKNLELALKNTKFRVLIQEHSQVLKLSEEI